MQTLAFLWFELKAAKRHVKEAVAESQPCGKVGFSLLKRPAESPGIDERPPHLSLRWIAKKETGVGNGPFLQERH
jgi:hypothetical protein